MPGITRRALLQGALAALATGGVADLASAAPAKTASRLWPGPIRPDMIVILTDQERAPTHWPKGLHSRLMPSWQRLAQHGLTFRNAFISAAQCSPSRAVLFSGQFANVNRVYRVLAGPAPPMPPLVQLPTLPSLLRAAGYQVAYKGKWHLSYAMSFKGSGSSANEVWTEADAAHLLDAYGTPDWNPPDAGDQLFNSVNGRKTLGGGTPNNDGRYVRGVTQPGQTPGFGESILDYLARVSKQKPGDRPPFFLFINLVNPHDIGFFPDGYDQAGYRNRDFDHLDVGPPTNHDDPLTTKPSVQKAFRKAFQALAPLKTPTDIQRYPKFYAHLHGVVETHIAAILDALDQHGLTDNTIIFRSADHGEMGLSHGLREKDYTAYEETIRVPLVISSPRLYPTARVTEAFWSHIDFLPTVTELAGAQAVGVGKSAVPIMRDPTTRVRDDALFVYDDQVALPLNAPGSHIRALRTARSMYAVYYSANGTGFEYELYDLAADPGQMRNLLYRPSSAVIPLWKSLHRTLSARLDETLSAPMTCVWPLDPTRT